MPDTDPTADKSGLIARMGARLQLHKSNATRLASELAEAKRLNVELTADRDAFKLKADGSQTLKALDAARAEVRELKQRGAFDALAKSKGVLPGAIADVWTHSGYKPEGDVADEARMGELIDAQKAARPYLFEQPKGADEPFQPARAAGTGQGGPASKVRQFTDEQMGDAAFVMRNQAAIINAAKQAVERNGS